MQPLF